jgi:signal transduction histidine kinase
VRVAILELAPARVRSAGNGPARVALTYAALACAWILLSDVALARLVSHPDLIGMGIVKGLGFAATTALLLYFLMRKEQRQLLKANDDLALANDELRQLADFLHLSPSPAVLLQAGTVIHSNGAARHAAQAAEVDVSGLLPAAVDTITAEVASAPSVHMESSRGGVVWRWSFFRGQGGAVFGYAHDATEEKQLSAQLVHSAKMEAVGQMSATVAHNFNNLLQVVRTYSQLTLASPELPATVRPDVEEISRVAEAGMDVVERLMHFSRDGQHCPDGMLVDIAEAVSEALSLVRALLPRSVELETSVPDRTSLRLLSTSEVSQVLMNLATNAVAAMPGGGKLRVELKKLGTGVELRVSDTGKGIEQAVRERMFEPFFTTRPTSGGTGLGLTFVQTTVRQRGGTIAVESAPGEGTTFILCFPVCS